MQWRVLTGRGADLIIIDDPLKPEDALSQAQRHACNDWYDHTLYSRINDKQRGYQAAAVLDDMINGRPIPKDPIYIEPAGVARRASTDILASNWRMNTDVGSGSLSPNRSAAVWPIPAE